MRLATTGRAFHMASATVRPKPSAMLFCTTTSARRCSALTIAAFTWEGLDRERVVFIAPSIDAFSPKNQELDAGTVNAILAVAGLNDGWAHDEVPTFTCEDGSPGRVERHAQLWEGRPLRPDDRVVLQVSRWDSLKDPSGVVAGFAEHVAPRPAWRRSRTATSSGPSWPPRSCTTRRR